MLQCKTWKLFQLLVIFISQSFTHIPGQTTSVYKFASSHTSRWSYFSARVIYFDKKFWLYNKKDDPSPTFCLSLGSIKGNLPNGSASDCVCSRKTRWCQIGCHRNNAIITMVLEAVVEWIGHCFLSLSLTNSCMQVLQYLVMSTWREITHWPTSLMFYQPLYLSVWWLTALWSDLLQQHVSFPFCFCSDDMQYEHLGVLVW